MAYESILIGIISTIITYMYMRWSKSRDEKINKKPIKKNINLTIPLMIGVIAWFISDSYFFKNQVNITYPVQNQLINQNVDIIQNPIIQTKSIGSCSYELVDVKPSTIPNHINNISCIPEVFLQDELP